MLNSIPSSKYFGFKSPSICSGFVSTCLKLTNSESFESN